MSDAHGFDEAQLRAIREEMERTLNTPTPAPAKPAVNKPIRTGAWPPPSGPHPDIRRGRWALWDRLTWIQEPEWAVPVG